MTLQIHTKRLDNELLALAVPMPQLSTAAVTLSFRAGARQDEISGTAHFLEHMAFQGTERRNAREIDEAIEDVGGEHNAGTSYETTRYEAWQLLTEHLPIAVDVLADSARFPTFPDREMTRQRDVILDEISMYKDLPPHHVGELLMQAVFPQHALGRSIAGDAETLTDITPDVLRAYRTANYHASNAIFAVAGGVESEQVFALAEQFYGDMPAAPAIPLSAPVFTAGEIHEERPLDQAHLRLAFPAPCYNHDDLPVAEIFAHCLGGGMTSRLFRKIREEMGLCYDIHAGLGAFSDTGLLIIGTATAPENLPKLLPAIAETVREAAKELTAEEIARAKAGIKTSLLTVRENPASLANYATGKFFIHGRVPDMEEEVAKIDAVDANALAHFAQTYIMSQPPAMAALGPLANLESQADFAARLTNGEPGITNRFRRPPNKLKGDTMLMKWEYDKITAEAAREVPIINCEDPKPQATPKWDFSKEIWHQRLRPSDKPAHEEWPEPPEKICPDTITKQFAKGHYLHGLALVARWGWMERTGIYEKNSLDDMFNALAFCAKDLPKTRCINNSWKRLTGNEKRQLAWSPVMASKTLHFLSRAVGFEQNPPVPIDNKVILEKVWPCWEEKVSTSGHTPPENWGWKGAKDGGLAGYLRYMTAICAWAKKKDWMTRDWTTTEMEATIYKRFR